MSQRVGRLTLAVTLIGMGAVLVADNVWGTAIAWYAGRFWPALLILLGLEWVAAAGRTNGDARPMGVDGGAVVLLVIIGLVMASTSSWNSNPLRHVRMEMPVMPPNMVPRVFGVSPTVSTEVVLTGGGPVEDLQEVLINGRSGNITVVEGPEFKVDLTVRAYGRDTADADVRARMVQLVVDSGSHSRVSATWPGVMERLDLHYRVTVPAGVRVKAETSSGAIDIRGRKADVSAVSTSGEVTVHDVTGNVAATSSSGSILVEDVTGSVTANATSGSVAVRFAAGPVTAQASSGNVTVAAAKVGGDYDLRASSGNVTVFLPFLAQVEVDARASSGRVAGPAWLTLGEGRGSGTGKQGDETHKLTLRTSSGNISITEQ